GAFEDVAREYLNVDTPADYFGHFLLGSAAVSQLVARGAWVHRDDRPQLEFVAARRFLDNDYPGDVFDSLAALGGATLAGSGPPRGAGRARRSLGGRHRRYAGGDAPSTRDAAPPDSRGSVARRADANRPPRAAGRGRLPHGRIPADPSRLGKPL